MMPVKVYGAQNDADFKHAYVAARVIPHHWIGAAYEVEVNGREFQVTQQKRQIVVHCPDDAVCQYRFERVSAKEVKRITLADMSEKLFTVIGPCKVLTHSR